MSAGAVVRPYPLRRQLQFRLDHESELVPSSITNPRHTHARAERVSACTQCTEMGIGGKRTFGRGGWGGAIQHSHQLVILTHSGAHFGKGHVGTRCVAPPHQLHTPMYASVSLLEQDERPSHVFQTISFQTHRTGAYPSSKERQAGRDFLRFDIERRWWHIHHYQYRTHQTTNQPNPQNEPHLPRSV